MFRFLVKLLTPARRELGKLIGVAKNGIKLYEREGKYGERILTSVKKDGSIFKEVTRENINVAGKYDTQVGISSTIKDFDKGITIFTKNTETTLNTPVSWLNRHFGRGDVVKYSGRSVYNGTGRVDYNDLIDGIDKYTLKGSNGWSYDIHSRPGITRLTQKYGGEYPQTIDGFEMHDFKFPNGKSVHNGRIAYTSGVSPLEGNYYRKTRLNPFGDNLSIRYL